MTPERQLLLYKLIYQAYLALGLGALVGLVSLVRLEQYPLVSLVLLGGSMFFLQTVQTRARSLWEHRHIPGPRPRFLMGNLPELLRYGHPYRERALNELHAEYGSVVRLHLGWGSAPLVSMSDGSKLLHSRELDSVREADRTVLGENLMGIRMGATHQHRRSVLRPFLQGDRVRERVPVVAPLLRERVERWRRDGASGDALQRDILSWSIHALGRALCGEDWDTTRDVGRYHQAIEGIEEVISVRAFHPPFVRWLFWGTARRAREDVHYFRGFIAELLDRRVARLADDAEEPADVLGLMARLASEEGYRSPDKEAIRWTREECVGELVSLLAGGTDAICHVASQSLYHLGHNPDAQRRVFDALAAQPGFETMVVHETLRLSPPLPFSAKVCYGRAFEIHGRFIPRGTMLLPFRPAIGCNESFYPGAERFAPERFASGCPHRQAVRSMLPFGAGPRICPGQMLTQELVGGFIREVVQAFQIEARPAESVELSSTIAARASTIPVRLTPRDPAPVGERRCPRAAVE